MFAAPIYGGHDRKWSINRSESFYKKEGGGGPAT